MSDTTLSYGNAVSNPPQPALADVPPCGLHHSEPPVAGGPEIPESVLDALSAVPAGWEPDWRAAYAEARAEVKRLRAMLPSEESLVARAVAVCCDLSAMTGNSVSFDLDIWAHDSGTRHEVEWRLWDAGMRENFHGHDLDSVADAFRNSWASRTI